MTFSPDEIRELCRRRDAGIVADAAFRDPVAKRTVGDATPAEVAYLVADGHAARRELIEGSLALVGFVVNRFTRDVELRAEMFQEGCVALAQAVDRFDPTKGALSTFAVAYIRGAVIMTAETNGGQLHLTHDQARSVMLVRSEIQRREAANLSTSPADLAEALGRSERWVRDVTAFQRHVTLSRPGGDIDVAHAYAGDPYENAGDLKVRRLVQMLPPRERKALELVYGLTGDARSHQEAGGELGCSPATVRRLVDVGLSQLRTLTQQYEGTLQPNGADTVATRRTETPPSPRSRRSVAKTGGHPAGTPPVQVTRMC